ncbi:ferredoxin [Mycobacteriaceae bacterium NPDC060252]
MTLISIDQNMCMSSEYCVRSNPELFSVDADGVARLVVGGAGPAELTEPHLQAAVAAATVCPAGAIEIHGPAGET